MRTQELWDLAIVATGSIAGVAADATTKTKLTSPSASKLEKIRILNLGVLAAKLIEVQFTLENPQPSQEETISRRLPRLLTQLEEVVTWPINTSMNERHNTRNTKASEFSTLQSLLQPSSTTRSALQKALVNFASSGGDKLGKFCTNLDRFAGVPRSAAQLPYTSNCVDKSQLEHIIPPMEYPSRVNELIYSTLSRHSHCTCPSSKDEPNAVQKHWIRLRLMDKVRFTQDDIFFDMLFSAAPACLPDGVFMKWQQLRFQVPKQETRMRNIRFLDQDPLVPEHSTNQDEARVVEIGHFCDLLGRSLGTVCIRLKVMNGHLHQFFQPDVADRRVVEAPSISLSQVLELEKISTKGRILLAYILAKSVWRYYDSDFMRTKWTTETIHFMREYRLDPDKDEDQEKIDPLSPFLAFLHIGNDQNELKERCQTFSVLHRYPRILALGIMLVEICRKKPKKAASELRSYEDQINTDFTIYNEIARSTNWPSLGVRNEEIRNRYRAVVQSCLDPKRFHISASMTTGQSDVDLRRDILYKNVVFPLEQLCAELEIIDQPEVVELLDYHSTGSEIRKFPDATLLAESENRRLPKSPKEWIEWTIGAGPFDLAHKYRENSRIRRIRIAILDTGYDARSPFFNPNPRHKRLIMWRDFAKDMPEPTDSDGHGTHVVSLAMKIAPAADICVARVATNSADLGKASHNIARAIDWAAETAEADVISMSFGFSEEPQVDDESILSNAITQALARRNQRILFFAAAANDGGNQIEMFPARHPSVFSIRATDHQGAFLTLNPPPDFSGVDVFGTLGREVPAAPLSSQRTDTGEVCMTGTSAATPIAAGIAATILGYARLRLEKETKVDLNALKLIWTERGMRLMLLKLSRKMGEKQYYLYAEKFIWQSDMVRDAMLLDASMQAKHGV